ncbi:MAG: ISAs1 family transposase [Gammaproteobacteria bacterium]
MTWIKSIGLVETRVERKGKVTQEKRYYSYYISSLPAAAKRLNDAARAHWGIENQLHWRLDVVFNEDGGCIRNDNAAGNRSAPSKKPSSLGDLLLPLKISIYCESGL